MTYTAAITRLFLVLSLSLGMSALPLLGASPGQGESRMAGSSAKVAAAYIRNVDVRADVEHADIEIEVSASVVPHTEVLTSPDRLALDFPGTLPANPALRLPVNAAGIRSVRMALFRSAPPVTRIVVEFTGKRAFELVPSTNKWVVKIGASAAPPLVTAAGPMPHARLGPSHGGALPAKSTPSEKPLAYRELSRRADALSSPTALAGTAPPRHTISAVSVSTTPEEEIVIVGNLSENVRALTLDHPDRIVLDFPNTLPDQLPTRIPGTGRSVRQVRVGIFRDSPPITRLVADLGAARSFQLLPSAGQLILRFAAPATPTPPRAQVSHASRQTPFATPTTTVSLTPPTPPLPVVPLSFDYNGDLLTIRGENCTLGEILLGLRNTLHVDVDVPPKTMGQRVFVHLGPASPREVIDALLIGSGFNYIVVGTESDPKAISRLIVNARAEGAEEDGWREVAPAPNGSQPPAVEPAPGSTPDPQTPPPYAR